jgi:arginyl-tRNA synthetase
MVTSQVKAQITDFLKTNYSISDPIFDVLPTNNFKDGDFYTNVALKYSKQANLKPMELALALKKNLTSDNYKIQVKEPGFINFYLSDKYLADLSYTFLNKDEDIAKFNLTLNFNPVVLEYSSPNIAKPFTIGHLRSTVIGDSVRRLLQNAGVKVITDNHLGDWGTQFGKQIYAIKTWHLDKGKTLKDIEQANNPVKVLVDLYVKFHKEAEKDSKLEDAARAWFKKLEDGDKEARELWKFCVNVSLKEFAELYKILDIPPFTLGSGNGLGESFYEDKMPAVLNELKQKGLLKEDKGAQLVYFEESTKLPPLMIVKKDGTTLYATRDLATDKYRLKEYGQKTMIINEVGSEQSLYFEQLFKLEEVLGWVKPGQRKHIKHGLYRFKDKKMSTRKGNVLWLSDLIDEALVRVEKINKENALQVAVGAIKWNDLKREPHKDIVFDWDEILNLKGNSGPYVQYTYARCHSLLNNEKLKINNADNCKLKIENSDERQVLRLLARFTGEVERATNELSPHYICHYLFELCQTYNSFYAKHKIVGGKNEQTDIVITKAVAAVIKNGLNLLGIKAPKAM